jgi:hypothetical protein
MHPSLGCFNNHHRKEAEAEAEAGNALSKSKTRTDKERVLSPVAQVFITKSNHKSIERRIPAHKTQRNIVKVQR